jgi:hypothetical protein
VFLRYVSWTMAGLHVASKPMLSSLLSAFGPCRWSGITPEHLANVTVTLGDVQERIRALLPPNAILVGHSLESDLKALKVQASVDEPIIVLGRHAMYTIAMRDGCWFWSQSPAIEETLHFGSLCMTGSLTRRCSIPTRPVALTRTALSLWPSASSTDPFSRYGVAGCSCFICGRQDTDLEARSKPYALTATHGIPCCIVEYKSLQFVRCSLTSSSLAYLVLISACTRVTSRSTRLTHAQGDGHDSIEDARACLDLVKLKLRRGMDHGGFVQSGV